MANDFFSDYLQYVGDTEVPVFFHRWSALVGLAAFLERNYYLNHGHSVIYPNTYAMLIGSPGTRKSSAIKLFKKIIQGAGYTTIAADKSTKEKFLADLAGISTHESEGSGGTIADIIETNLWGDDPESAPPVQCFIAADEFNDFFGNGNLEFISLLGSLWDFNGVYTSRIKNGKSIEINNPTISILGGNTPTGFAHAFPPETLGQGFFSRILLIYGEGTGKRIAFPSTPQESETREIISALQRCKMSATGCVELSPGVKELLTSIYTEYDPIDDVRFESYSNRRFTHLLKLCLVVAASNYRSEIIESDVVAANTILTYTEHLMPKALGEFGAAKHAEVANAVITFLQGKAGITPMTDIWPQVSMNLDRQDDLIRILLNLEKAHKIIRLTGGYSVKTKPSKLSEGKFIDTSILSVEEMKTIGS